LVTNAQTGRATGARGSNEKGYSPRGKLHESRYSSGYVMLYYLICSIG